MNEALLRNSLNNNAETIAFVIILILLVIAKLSNENRFNHYISLFYSNKYLKIYGKEQDLVLTQFNILLFIVQIACYSVVTFQAIHIFNIPIHLNVYLIFTFLFLFILIKFYVEKTIATIFNITTFTERFHFNKISFRNLSTIYLLPFVALLIYSDLNKKIVLFIIIGLFIVFNAIGIGVTFRYYQKFIGNNMFYFILYLCALEIAPYLIIGKLITNK
ncbi:DUF4271 domain-containing protein [Zhouia sp. PK063]|uniref:DUF4271 domain-containing protein n=1 Tax=Zhouia sp. PK063 TaxID=3373602 RepID=UPI00378D4410